MKENQDSKEITEKIKELVIARIESQVTPNMKLVIGGSEGSLSREDMIRHVKKGDEKGQQIIQMHMNFIKALTSGEFIRAINSI